MQDLLTYSVEVIAIAFVALMIVDFIQGLLPVAPPTKSIQYFVDLSEEEEDTTSDETAIAPQVCNNIKPLVADANTLDNLTIRQLKKMASAAKVKNYNIMTKAQLVTTLSG
jgi:hypothetical protein